MKIGPWCVAGREAILPYAPNAAVFRQRSGKSIVICVEPSPHCFELEPGEKLTMIWDAGKRGEAAQVNFSSGEQLDVWPSGSLFADIQFVIDGVDAKDRNWIFKLK